MSVETVTIETGVTIVEPLGVFFDGKSLWDRRRVEMRAGGEPITRFIEERRLSFLEGVIFAGEWQKK